MNRNDLDRLKAWFSDYCRSFETAEGNDPRPYEVKEEHTRKVCENILAVARSLLLDERDAAIAEAVALFHDVGRFPQYRQYGTFRDSASVNHAALSAKVLVEEGVLSRLSDSERKVITKAVTLHNVLTVPEGLDDGTLLFTKLIRDADKLDIWRVFVDYYRTPEHERSAVIGLALPETPGYSAEVLACLRNGEMIRHTMVHTQNDFKLLQLSWVYDLNFPGSFRLVAERGYIDGIAATLPGTEEVKAAVAGVKAYVERKRGDGRRGRAGMPDKKVTVTIYAGYKAGERPKSFIIEGKTVEVLEIVKMWIEEDRDTRKRKRFFAIKGGDGKEYTLYSDEAAERWYLKEA